MQERLALILFLAIPISHGPPERVAPAPPMPAQREPADYLEALRLLDAGDTTAALQRLRSLTEEEPDFGPGFLKLGSVLSATASEVESEFRARLEAERALRRAWRLLGDDPVVLLEYGLLLRKQRRRVDARRVLDRAWESAGRKGLELAPEDRARLHHSLGLMYETWWEDWQDLVFLPEMRRGELFCAATLGTPMQGPVPFAHARWAVFCPEKWWEQVTHLSLLAEMKSEERDRMVRHFRRALAADPAHVDAAVRLLGHLADAGSWQEYLNVAQRLVAAAPSSPRAQLFLGLGLHERGRDAEADAAFSVALSLLSPTERAVFEDVTLLVPRSIRERYAGLDSAGRAATADLLFTAKDPLFLTDAEERRLEHYARLAWAELKFGEPATGRRGWDSERGRIFIRYGKPDRRIQCCYGAGRGRFITWSYGETGPNFSFSRPLTYRHALMTEPAKQLADDLEERAPEFYRPRTVTAVHRLPHQVARFRAKDPDLARVEIYAQAPVGALEASRGDTLETGIFLFTGDYESLWERRNEAIVGDEKLGLTYLFDLPPGEYQYGLEARRTAPDSIARPLARARQPLTTRAYPEGELAVSDILLAHAVTPRVQRPARRADLRIAPNRTGSYAPGAPVHLYFETYGLRVDDEGLATYRVDLRVEGAETPNLVQRIARGITEIFRRGGDEDPRVSWERTVPVAGDRAVDYLSVELPTLEEGAYLIRLLITDRATGESVGAERRFRVGQGGSGG